MAKSNVYPLVAPGFPCFIPVAPTSKPPGRWREWGRSSPPAPIRIGLPLPPARTAQRRSEYVTEVDTTVSTRRTDIEPDLYPRHELRRN